MTYDSLNAPKEKPLWAVAYSINDDTEHHRLMCKPQRGELIKHNKIAIQRSDKK